MVAQREGGSPEAAADRCPKCDAAVVRSGAESCARCGLSRSRWTGFQAPSSSEELAAAWRDCEAAWDDPSRHDRALDLAGRTGELAELARRYRLRQRDEAGDELAEKRLARIAVLVELAARAQAQAASLARASSARIASIVGYVLAGLLLVGSGYILFRVLAKH